MELTRNTKIKLSQIIDLKDWAEDIKYKAELHWYECKGVGKKDFKVKKWLEEK